LITPGAFLLADLQIVPLSLTVRRGEQAVLIQQKPMEVLTVLAQRYPALVSREELINSVWDGNVYVGEKALTNAIWQLRQLFIQLDAGDLISTVRKKGYRLTVEPVATAASGTSDAAASTMSGVAGADDDTGSGVGKSCATQMAELPELKAKIAAGLISVNRPERAAQSKTARWQLLIVMLVCAVAMVFWWWLRPTSVTPSVEQVTRQLGWSMYPAVSPDGSTLVYSHQLYGQNRNLFALDLRAAQAVPRQLTFNADDKYRPVWSLDGSRVFYSSRSIKGHCAIQALTLETLQEEQLVRCGRYGDVYLDVSPDGRYLYFNGSLTEDGRSLYRLDLQQPAAVAQALPCTDFCQQRVRDIAASPDGQWLAITRRANRLSEEVFLYNLASASERQLTFGHADVRGLEWRPDSRHLVLSAVENGRGVAYLLDTVSGSQQQLLHEDFSYPSRINREGWLYFQHDNSMPQLGYLQLQSASALFPLTAGDQAFQSPDFHQGRQQLVYISTESGQAELWLSDRRLQQKKQLTRLGGTLKYPRWSHDGRRVLFVSRKAESVQDRLSIVDVETGQLSYVKTGLQMHGRPAWWHDDSAVFLPQKGQLLKFDLTLLQSEVVTEVGADFAQMPDETGFYFSKGRSSGLWWQSTEPGVPAQQLLTADEFSDPFAWTASKDAVYFLRQQDNGVALKVWRSGAQLQQLVLLPSEQVNLSSSPAFDAIAERLVLEFSPVPRIDIMRWQLR